MSASLPLRCIVLAVALTVLTHDLCAQWQRVPLPGRYNDGYYLDVSFLPEDPRFGWACSMEGYVVRTTDGGRTWLGSAIDEVFFEHVQFLNRFEGYCSGSNGIYKSTNGGVTWFDVTPRRFFQFPDKGWGCYFLNENEGFWFVGGCGSNIQSFYRTTDGGRSWNVFLAFENNTGLTDGVVDENGEGYAVSSGALWQTLDRGETWRVIMRTPVNAWTEEYTRFGESLLLPTSGNSCDGEPRGIGSLQFTTDAGSTWTVFQTNAAMFGSFLLDEQRGWGVGDAGACYYTEDAGENWELRDCGLEGVSLDDVYFINDTLGFIGGDGLFRSNFTALSVNVAIDGPDTLTICTGDSVRLSVNDGLRDYRWTTGARGTAITVTKEGTYGIRAVDPETCVATEDSVIVMIKQPRVPQTLSASTRYCEGDTAAIVVNDPSFLAYRWSTGDTTSAIRVASSGAYYVEALDSTGCWARSAVIDVQFLPRPVAQLALSGPTTFCLDDSLVISLRGTYASYRWSNGSIEPSITVKDPGTFFVIVTDSNGCVDTSEVLAVDVIRTRNKIDLMALQRPFQVVAHDVGARACADIQIRNRSSDEPLVISRPMLVFNTTFGIPPEQLPIVIPPGEQARLTICCAAADTGAVADTLILNDTCSPSVIPVVSRGLPYDLTGTSRCDVATQVTVIRAGLAYRTSPPYPVPADQAVMFTIVMPRGLQSPSVTLRDATLREIRRVTVAGLDEVPDGTGYTFSIHTADLPVGTYFIVATSPDGIHHVVPVPVIH